ncbi:hypothetical protein ACN469_31675 [Corallococcus terminator]
MLEAELHPRLTRIKIQEFRTEAESAVRSGELRKLIRLLGPVPGDPLPQDVPAFQPTFDVAEIEREARVIREGALARGLDISEQFTQAMVFMRHIMVPVKDPALGLALSRIWSIVLSTDLESEYERDLSFLVLKHASGVAHQPSPLTDYIDHAFAEIGHYCDTEFLALFKSLFYRAYVGFLFEVMVVQAGAERTAHSARYIRDQNGFGEFWYITLQFIDERLSFSRNPMFWVDTIEAGRDFIGLANDVFSFYKEALAPADFENSYLFRQSAVQKRPFLDVFKETVDTTLRSYQAILEAASSGPPELRAHVEYYLKSFLFYHVRSSRYQLRDVYPELRYWDELPPPAPGLVG